MVAAIRALRVLCLLVTFLCCLALVDLEFRPVAVGEDDFRETYGIGGGLSRGGTALRVAALGVGAYVMSRALKAPSPSHATAQRRQRSAAAPSCL